MSEISDLLGEGTKKTKTRASKRLGLEAVPGSGLRFSVGDVHCEGAGGIVVKASREAQDHVRIDRQVSGAARTTAQLNSMEKYFQKYFTGENKLS